MKGRLITNGILSLISSGLFIAFIVLVVKASHGITTTTTTSLSGALASATTTTAVAGKTLLLSAGIWAMMSVGLFISFVMGIITLSMKKSPNAHGLTIASGVLAILGGLFGIGAIVSFMAAKRV